MDPIHKQALSNKTTVIMGRISSPTVLTAYLPQIFNSSDTEQIKAKENLMGATHATQTLLSLLEKRGPRAFGIFLAALREPGNKMLDLADELEDEVRRLQGKTVPVRRAQSLPQSAEDVGDDLEVRSPPPPYSSLAGVQNCSVASVNGGAYDCNLERGSENASKQPPGADMNNQAQEPAVLSEATLVRDIPYRLRQRIEDLLDIPDPNHHDWRGMASVMNMNTEEVRRLENAQQNGKMKGLIERMIQKNKTVNDLLTWLKHADLERWDVIDEIRKEPNNISATLLSGTENSESDQSDAACATSPVEETCRAPEEKSMQPPLSQQECGQDPPKDDAKPDARVPVQEEKPDVNKKQANVYAEPDACLTSPMGDLNIDDKPDYRTPSQEEGNHDSMTSNDDDDDDDVFDSTGNVQKQFHALLISCSTGNDREDKKHDSELRKLETELEDSWEVVSKVKCKVSNLNQTVHSFLRHPGESGKFVSFVYLVGPTVQINGENYLLPSDLKNPSSRADLMHSSLNINWLVKQLSETYMQVVIVDGAHENTVKDVNITGVLQGLAPIQPPPNAVIVFPSPPGTIRPNQERLLYIQSVVKNLEEGSNIMVADLFERVRADLAEQSVSSPVEFSLTSSPLPLCIKPDEGFPVLQVDSVEGITYHALVVANSKYEGLSVNTNQCMKNCEQLQMALLKTGWNCDLEVCDKSAKIIKDELERALNKLADDRKRAVLVYFMGYTKTIMDGNYFFGSDFKLGVEPLRCSLSLQWTLDLMCEKLLGKKILIVDDLNTSSREGLKEMTAPLDVMISIPTGTRGNSLSSNRQHEASFTSNFARLLEAKSGELPLKEMVKRAARGSFDQHRLSSNLFDPK